MLGDRVDDLRQDVRPLGGDVELFAGIVAEVEKQWRIVKLRLVGAAAGSRDKWPSTVRGASRKARCRDK